MGLLDELMSGINDDDAQNNEKVKDTEGENEVTAESAETGTEGEGESQDKSDWYSNQFMEYAGIK